MGKAAACSSVTYQEKTLAVGSIDIQPETLSWCVAFTLVEEGK